MSLEVSDVMVGKIIEVELNGKLTKEDYET